MLQGEHSAIILTLIKLPFVINIFILSIFEWPLKTGFTVHNGHDCPKLTLKHLCPWQMNIYIVFKAKKLSIKHIFLAKISQISLRLYCTNMQPWSQFYTELYYDTHQDNSAEYEIICYKQDE